MNVERVKEMLPIIQAFAEGKAIQVDTGNSGVWTDTDYLFPDQLFYRYRVKPAPREFWLVAHEHMPWNVWSKTPAPMAGREIIHVREVLP